MRLVRGFMNWFARRAGYVPAADLAKAVAASDKANRALATANDALRNEVLYLRVLQLAHAKRESGVTQAVDKLDTITASLHQMMMDVWPDAYLLDAERVEA